MSRSASAFVSRDGLLDHDMQPGFQGGHSKGGVLVMSGVAIMDGVHRAGRKELLRISECLQGRNCSRGANASQTRWSSQRATYGLSKDSPRVLADITETDDSNSNFVHDIQDLEWPTNYRIAGPAEQAYKNCPCFKGRQP